MISGRLVLIFEGNSRWGISKGGNRTIIGSNPLHRRFR
jgi:hypothetical protein